MLIIEDDQEIRGRLRAALESVGFEVEERANETARLEHQNRSLAQRLDLEAALLREVREALQEESARRGRAVAISLAVEGSEVVLRLEDDGAGFAPDDAGRQGLGLLGMQERAAALGGEVRFAPGRAAGTLVTARLPLSRIAPPAASHPQVAR